MFTSRQSTPHQVISNQESLRLQFSPRERAHELGWHDADIDVIDADLGMSGASAIRRNGFKELVGRVGLSEIGLILSIDVTRLARNCSDWYPLLDMCGLRGCLIADRDGVYDPCSANGRLLLGVKTALSPSMCFGAVFREWLPRRPHDRRVQISAQTAQAGGLDGQPQR
ncbi:recombinase family protein [Sinorhizobium meliloti]|uniref:recombinase family protein n=1 Tax=Rhizobium meliloti TaxID=382 RepID=UPI001F331BDB|nr:recombinase family protein [Sinorhizobium meliloti]